jgi:chromosomal replication initiation ATPase DnaA
MTAENFCVGRSNQDAWAWIQAGPLWPTPGLMLYGPLGCGKTHLGRILADRTQAFWLDHTDISLTTPASLAASHTRIILDDADQAVERSGETALFVLHLYNMLKEKGGALVLLASKPPAHWACELPDLISRLNTLSIIPIHAPDDALMQRLMLKLFQDCQMTVNEGVVIYLLRHMERSFAEAHRLVSQLNELSLLEKRPITVDLCRRLFSKEPEKDNMAKN